MTVRLRPVRPGDEEFLYSVYASTRTDEMELVDWNPAQKDAFLRMQFHAQDLSFHENYSGAHYSVILQDEQPVGRLYVQRRSDEIRIMEISLLPAFRHLGIGSHLLNEILENGSRSNLPVTLHVECFNPALHLYERLGFHLMEARGVYYFMRWQPTPTEQHETIGSTAK